MNKHSSINNTKVCSVSRTARLVKQAYMDMDISVDIHGKSVDMDMDMDEKFHIHGKPADYTSFHRTYFLFSAISKRQFTSV